MLKLIGVGILALLIPTSTQATELDYELCAATQLDVARHHVSWGAIRDNLKFQARFFYWKAGKDRGEWYNRDEIDGQIHFTESELKKNPQYGMRNLLEYSDRCTVFAEKEGVYSGWDDGYDDSWP